MDSALEMIRRAIALFFLSGAVVELRIPKAGKHQTISGYFDDAERLARSALANDGKGPGVYWTLNPVLTDLLARRANRTEPYAKETTTDEQIVSRRWLMIDCDPKRPAGISATDAEHSAALERARQIRARLAQEGWPDPVYVDSGNGAHLLYPCDLPNDPASTDLIKRVLKALASRHDDAAVEVDQTTYNAARICKVPGTFARKGDSLPERPHRMAQLLDVPTPLITVPSELITKLAAEAMEDSRATQPHKKGSDYAKLAAAFDIDRWIAGVGIEVIKVVSQNGGGRKWQIRCPFKLEHDNAAIFQAADGKLGFHCFHNSCRGYDWHALRSKVDPAYRPPDSSAEAPNPSDVGNAKRLVARHGKNIRYCHDWGRWLVWDGKRWRIDDTGAIERLAKETVEAMFTEAAMLSGDARTDLLKHALKSEHEQRIKAMIALAKSENGIPVRPAQLDGHPLLLNVENGTLDLRTGELREARHEDLLTKLVPIAYDATAKAPTFTRFIAQSMSGRRKVIRYLQRALGYTLTGSTVEQVFFVLYGTGSNGKSTLLTLIHDMLGPDYAMDTSPDTFTSKEFGDGIPNDLARLKGARFVTAIELDSRKLDEQKLKRITGQDPITARFMRAEFFQYLPEFKLFIACNKKPRIESDGIAIWRRIQLIPFDAVIQNPDRTLPEKLRRELPGILSWCVRGCLAWHKFGLGTAQTIQAATAAYRFEMDSVGRFSAAYCENAAEALTPAKDLYAAYRLWCGQNRESALTQAAFGRKLTDRGLLWVRAGADGATAYRGIRLQAAALNDPNDPNDFCNNSLESSPIGPETEKVQTEGFSFSPTSQPPSTPTAQSIDPSDAKESWVL